MKRPAALAFALFFALPVWAQSLVLPDASYDAFAEISMVTTAKQSCPRAQVDDGRLQKAMVAALTDLAKAGINPNDAVEHLGTPEGEAPIIAREKALRAAHGSPADGMEGLCAAIAAETKQNRALRRMVKFR